MKLNLRKFITMLSVVCAVLSFSMLSVGAVGVANTEVTAAMTTLKDDLMATLGAVAVVGIVIMGVFLAWKYGKRIFNQVAK